MIRERLLVISDFCCISSARVRLDNRGLVLITGDNQDTDAADNNGSGKSTILKALLWCLFGQTIDGDRYDEVIRWGAKKAEVQHVFDRGSDRWLVKRSRTKGSPSLSLHLLKKVKGDLLEAEATDWPGDSKELQAKIIELLGHDFRAFCNTKVFGQGDTNRFFSSTDATQKDTLHRILRSDVYKLAEKRLRERDVKALRAEVQEVESKLSTTQARLSEYDLAELRLRVDEWEETQEKRIEDAQQSAQDCIAHVRQAEQDSVVRRKQLLQGIAAADADAAKLSELLAEVQKLEEKIDEHEEKEAELEKQQSQLQYAIEGKDERLQLFDQELCDRCESPLSKGVPAKLRKRLEEERARLQTQLDAVERPLKALQDEMSKLNEQRGKLTQEIATQPEHEDAAEMRSELDKLNAALDERKNSLKQRAREYLAQAKQMLEEENPYEAGLQRAQQRIEELKKERDEVEKQLEEKRVELAHYEFWVRGFGSQGLPSLLLDSTMPYLTERTNSYLETLADGDITVGFSTQRELKRKDEKRDEITKNVTIEGVPNARPSHGQTKKLEIATDLALIDLAETREGGAGGLLIMDEVLDGLDSEGVSRVLRLLQELRSKRSSIFVVTHEPGLAEAFERVLHVTKKGQESTVSEVK